MIMTKTSRQEHVTLRCNKDLRHGEVKDEREAIREGVTIIKTLILSTAEKQTIFGKERKRVWMWGQHRIYQGYLQGGHDKCSS